MAMNSKKHRKSDEAVASLDKSECVNPDDNDHGDNRDDENLSKPEDSNVPNAGTSDQTDETSSLPTQSWTYKEGQFWNYVNDELAKFRRLVQEESLSASDADSQMIKYDLAHLINSRSLL